MTISYVALFPNSGYTRVNFTEFYMYMGYCSSDNLTENYQDNYVSGTRTTVFERTSAFTVNAVYPWTGIVLDTPFWYNPSAGNLVIEIAWPDGDDEIYTFNYGTPGVGSLVMGFYDLSYGGVFQEAPYLRFEGDYAFDQTTFAGIKASFR